MQIPVKVKATGEIVDVTIYVATAGNPLYTTSGGVTYLGDDIEPAEPDWQHYRIQASIAAMQGQLANDESVKQMIEILDYTSLPDKTKAYMNLVARSSVMLADALIEELKKGGQDD